MLWWDLRQIKSSRETARERAAKRLLRSSKPRVAQAFAGIIETGGSPEWGEAVWALAEGADARHQSLLLTALRRVVAVNDGRSAARLAKALARIGWQPGDDTDAFNYHLANRNFAQCVKIGAPARAPLLNHLEQRKEIPIAAWCVSGLLNAIAADAAELMDVLAWLLNSTSLTYAYFAANALGKSKAPAAVDQLVSVLSGHQPTDLKRSALTALLTLGDARTLQHVQTLLDSAWRTRRERAPLGPDVVALIRRLGWTPTPDQTGAFFLLMEGSWKDTVTLGPPAVETLLKWDRDYREHEWFNRALRESLAHLADAEKLRFVPELVSRDRREALRSLTRDPSSQVRCAAISLLCEADDIEAAFAALSDASPDVKEAARGAMDAIKKRLADDVSGSSENALRFLLAADDRDPVFASHLGAAAARLRSECEHEDTSHGGVTEWQMYGSWIACAEEYVRRCAEN